MWYSRYVVAWELDQSLELPFVLRAARRALAGAAPAIWNSDQGSHFTSRVPPECYLALLEGAAVRISMNGKGRTLDFYNHGLLHQQALCTLRTRRILPGDAKGRHGWSAAWWGDRWPTERT